MDWIKSEAHYLDLSDQECEVIVLNNGHGWTVMILYYDGEVQVNPKFDTEAEAVAAAEKMIQGWRGE